MEITLTNAQWNSLKDIVASGRQVEACLNLPIEVSNSAQSIEIEANEIKITLSD